jgi:hypothetical protein
LAGAINSIRGFADGGGVDQAEVGLKEAVNNAEAKVARSPQTHSYTVELAEAKRKLANYQAERGKAGGGLIRGFSRADGGHITGPGDGTSDSIMARLSNGEYVVRAAAVRAYGTDLFEALNNLQIGGFAAGGQVGGARAPSAPAGPSSASSVLNLTIDGNHFNGLRAPENVAAKLKTYAVGQQTSRTGRLPSWVS